ncbi:hypothetical protein RCL1_001556 [Eukaryota sp. TZLM3-RCL]
MDNTSSNRPYSAKNSNSSRFSRSLPRPMSAASDTGLKRAQRVYMNKSGHSHLPQEFVVLDDNSSSSPMDQRKIPSQIPKDPEALYEEIHALKLLKNNVTNELSSWKTRCLRSEEALAKTKRELTDLIRAKTIADATTLGLDCLRTDSSFIDRLREENIKLANELRSKDSQIDALKKESRVTRVQDLEAQLSTFVVEIQRLRSILIEFGIDATTGRRVEKRDPSKEMIRELKQNLSQVEEENKKLRKEVSESKLRQATNISDVELLKKQNVELLSQISILERDLREAPQLRKQQRQEHLCEQQQLKEELERKQHEIEVLKLAQIQVNSEQVNVCKSLEGKYNESKRLLGAEKERSNGLAQKVDIMTVEIDRLNGIVCDQQSKIDSLKASLNEKTLLLAQKNFTEISGIDDFDLQSTPRNHHPEVVEEDVIEPEMVAEQTDSLVISDSFVVEDVEVSSPLPLTPPPSHVLPLEQHSNDHLPPQDLASHTDSLVLSEAEEEEVEEEENKEEEEVFEVVEDESIMDHTGNKVEVDYEEFEDDDVM